MPCLLACAAMLSPRLAIVLLWLFTDKNTLAFDSGWLAIAGFLFLPWTTLAWILCFSPLMGTVTGFGWFLVGLGFVLDIMAWAGSARSRS